MCQEPLTITGFWPRLPDVNGFGKSVHLFPFHGFLHKTSFRRNPFAKLSRWCIDNGTQLQKASYG